MLFKFVVEKSAGEDAMKREVENCKECFIDIRYKLDPSFLMK